MQIAPIDAMEQLGGLVEIGRRLGGAALFGAVIGANRELNDKPAGVRTHALVALGASLLTVSGLLLGSGTGAGDAESRVIQGTITGVGFIGGGVILRDETRLSVYGLTTAASVWLAACLGIVCGLGHWATALVGLLMALLVLTLGIFVERALRRFATRRGPHAPRPEP